MCSDNTVSVCRGRLRDESAYCDEIQRASLHMTTAHTCVMIVMRHTLEALLRKNRHWHVHKRGAGVQLLWAELHFAATVLETDKGS